VKRLSSMETPDHSPI